MSSLAEMFEKCKGNIRGMLDKMDMGSHLPPQHRRFRKFQTLIEDSVYCFLRLARETPWYLGVNQINQIPRFWWVVSIRFHDLVLLLSPHLLFIIHSVFQQFSRATCTKLKRQLSCTDTNKVLQRPVQTWSCVCEAMLSLSWPPHLLQHWEASWDWPTYWYNSSSRPHDSVISFQQRWLELNCFGLFLVKK